MAKFLELLWPILYALGQMLIDVKGQKLEKQSSNLVTLYLCFKGGPVKSCLSVAKRNNWSDPIKLVLSKTI